MTENKNITPSKRRVSLGIQSIMDRLYLVRDGSEVSNSLKNSRMNLCIFRFKFA